MNRQEVFDHAVKHVQQQITGNKELFIAQVIKMNPEIDLLNYRVCHKPIEREGIFGESFWLERIDE